MLKLDLARTSAGIVLRSSGVDFLTLHGPHVTSSLRVPIAGTDPQQLSRALQEGMNATGMRARKVAVALSAEDVLVRFFKMPLLPKPEWDGAIQFEVRKYIPFKIDTLVWDYRVNTDSGARELEVIFLAIQREAFQRITEALTAAGLQASILEPSSVSLARLVDPVKGRPSNEFTCLVDVEEQVAHVLIVKNRLPYLAREISLLPPVGRSQAGARMAGEVEATSPEELQSAAPPRSEGDVRLERLLSELSVSMDFFRREHPTASISRVLLCGAEELLAPWSARLAERLYCPVELGTSLLRPRTQGNLSSTFAAAVGVAQVGRARAATAMDFLRRAPTKLGTSQRTGASASSELLAASQTPQAFLTAVVALAFLAVFWFFGSLQVSEAKRQLDQLVQARPDVGFGLSQLPQSQLDDLKQRASTQLELLKRLIGQRVSVAAKLDALARTLPEGVWLTRVSLEDRPDLTGKSEPRLLINGACYLGESGRELSTIQKFEQDIKHNPSFFNGFKSGHLEQINSQDAPVEQTTYRTFQLNCNT